MSEPRQPRMFTVTVESRPDGIVLSPSDAYTECLLKDVFTLLAGDGQLRDDLYDLLENEEQRDPHAIDQPSRDDALAERLVRALPAASRSLRLHQTAAASLRDRLAEILRGRRWSTGRRKAA